MSKIRRKEGLELKKNLPGYLLMAPAVIAVLALSVYPLFRGIYLSFLNYNLVRPNDPTFNTFAGLQNYIDIFKDKVFIQSIGNTVKWTVVGAGRTDAGVHASLMVAHFDSETPLDVIFMTDKLNRLLPPDISVYRQRAAHLGQEDQPEAT